MPESIVPDPDAATLRRLADESAIRRLACLYARGADRRDPAIWESIMLPDAVLITPNGMIEGRDRIVAVLPALGRMYVSTHHRVLNQLYDIDGDRASGETYCLADHLIEDKDGARTILSWAIRYQDDLRRVDGEWRIARRELLLDWAESRPLDGRAG